MALLRSPGRMREGHDGLAAPAAGEAASGSAEVLTVRLGREACVYDVRRARFLGRCESFEAPLEPGDAGIYALLPDPVSPVELMLPERVEPGERLEGTARLGAAGGPRAHAHVLSLSVFTPAEEYAWACSRNECSRDGSCRIAFRIPFDAPRGSWRVVVKDVASGVRAERKVAVG